MISRDKTIYNSIIFTNLTQDSKIKPLYTQWINFNRLFYAKYFIVLSILFSVLLIPFDFLWGFSSPSDYSIIRLLYIALLMPFMIYVVKANPIEQMDYYKVDITMVFISLAFNIKYIYFLYISSNYSGYTIVLLGNFFVIITSTLFMYRFWKEQYVVNFLSIVTLLNLAYFKPALQQDAIRLIYFHILSFLVAHYYRNQFLDNLYKKFLYISSMMPMKIAKYFTFTSGRYPIEEIFKSEEKFTVCLSSDWRNYQQFTDKMDDSSLSELIEKFYDIIFDKLDEYVPDGQYYADWTADELFIVFYDDDNDRNSVIDKSLRFANSLGTDIYMKIYSELNIDLKYDIGIASGPGFLGLQGPRKFKKTTITGNAPGIAKRLETEAKKIRKDTDGQSFPIIVMNEGLYERANSSIIYNKHKFQEILAKEKDIRDSKCYSWQFIVK